MITTYNSGLADRRKNYLRETLPMRIDFIDGLISGDKKVYSLLDISIYKGVHL